MRQKMMEWMKANEKNTFKFLRDLIALPSTSCNEKEVVSRIAKEMEALDFDEIIIDKMGNILGRVGSGARIIAFDGHIDTVDVGNLTNWTFDPFTGKEDDLHIFGRGASDQTGGFISAVYAAGMLKSMGLLEGVSLWVVGSVQEEDCDGLCWQHILNEKVIVPEFVVITEPTSLGVYRGQRGRMEIRVDVSGTSAHGSAPERGDNAIYKMAKIINELEALNEKLIHDDFLGKGTLAVSEIFYSSPSRCAVADSCAVSIDRRLTTGESPGYAVDQIRSLATVKDYGAVVDMYRYDKASYTGLVQDVPCEFPTWTIPEDHMLVKHLNDAHLKMHGEAPVTDKWTFSTNGVAIMGMNGIPCIGYGPGDEKEAHAPNEKIRKEDIRKAITTYACFVADLKG
ncbi:MULTISPECIES: YgeY family selenium metabolism-linked hydrolase [unclassified Fusibacter]|uniref:YgeY family selenium metabolism-linked hydrolase n=1 Tax=unclassified Fusibacter TaxID=2624464 RepID=UPI001012F5DC|nr:MULTISPECIES: YgeY family selenium metabolism-linked hydrolase [unclassified Fusibacter]MCK8060387.1 YgeY family selenium metabolism-linked hydrolase [Fusibacter sp. A2]NPE20324.1 YgeY family selenium metabolism-linked hydrolase [Fusibacter sp. A1]RXV63530.1 YgeY family selenium metabolism-linked hydrolase [Fusibacter sp. A1]